MEAGGFLDLEDARAQLRFLGLPQNLWVENVGGVGENGSVA